MTGDFVPADQLVRNAIRTRVGENMCVEAGAGTGKTTVLVDRIVNIIRSGHAQVRELAVITFTEKAAAELAGRVREQLEATRETAEDPAERERLDLALRDLTRAHIETIHAFASSLLRERPVEANVDPGFTVLTELPSQLAFEKSYSEWLAEQMEQDRPPDALIEALNLGAQIEWVREAAEALHKHRDLLPLTTVATPDAEIEPAIEALDGVCERLRAYESRIVDEDDGAYENMRRLLDVRDVFAGLRDRPDSLRRAIATVPEFKLNKGARQRWRSPGDCDAVKALLKEGVAVIDACASRMKQAATRRLLEWLQDFVHAYDGQRKVAGQADFDDLLIWARDVVRDNAEVRAYFQQQFRCILVDEFQDTDPLQAELIVRLAEEEGEHAADWRRARPRPGALFVVGDPKQSIYRFRRADIAMYDDVKQHVFGNAVERIVQNFRSAGPIIDWVNRRFASLITEQPQVQPPYVDLVPHPWYADAAPAVVEVIHRVIDKAYAPQIREAEAACIASRIAWAVAGREWMLREDRPATFRDVAVLIPSRSELQTYEDALARAGVPYRHEGGRTFFQRQEVRELIAVLRAIDDPEDTVAAVTALRSAAFGLSDEDLVRYRAAGGSFAYAPTGATGLVPETLHALAELRAMRHRDTLPDIVRAVIDRLRLVESAMLQPQGEQVAANLLKVIDQARAFAAASGAGLRGFVRWLKDSTARIADETDAAISEETDDVVRIVTVHASKGLEFPVVVFANMGTQWSDRTKIIPERARGRLHLKMGKADAGFRTPGWDAVAANEKQHDDAEHARLLYVAATRACDRLIVPLFVAKAKRPRPDEVRSANDLLRQSGVEDDGEPMSEAADTSLPPDAPLWRRPPGMSDAAAIERVRTERAEWQQSHDALVADAETPLDVRTASSLEQWEPQESDPAAPWRGRATEFGTAVHDVLEHIDLDRPDEADRLARAAAEAAGMPDRADEIADVVRNALSQPAVARALRSPRCLRETAFTALLPAGAGFAEGRIDLLFVEDGEIVVVDFKTDRVSGARIDKRAAHYRPQALVYAWAAHRATGMPVREVIFLFARPGTERSVRVDAAFMAEAEALLSGPAPAAAEPTPA